ncbi:MFS transporter [Actinomadura sp. KC345]|nr:MFS transporter [Actinomadura sp. KC345]
MRSPRHSFSRDVPPQAAPGHCHRGGGRAQLGTRRTWTIAAVVLVWSLLTVGSGLVQSYATLFAVRVFLGSAGLLYNPSGSSLIADYYPGSGRARAFGLERFAYFSGLPLGIMLGGALAQAFGRRAMFFLVAVPGVVIALLCCAAPSPCCCSRCWPGR